MVLRARLLLRQAAAAAPARRPTVLRRRRRRVRRRRRHSVLRGRIACAVRRLHERGGGDRIAVRMRRLQGRQRAHTTQQATLNAHRATRSVHHTSGRDGVRCGDHVHAARKADAQWAGSSDAHECYSDPFVSPWLRVCARARARARARVSVSVSVGACACVRVHCAGGQAKDRWHPPAGQARARRWPLHRGQARAP